MERVAWFDGEFRDCGFGLLCGWLSSVYLDLNGCVGANFADAVVRCADGGLCQPAFFPCDVYFVSA